MKIKIPFLKFSTTGTYITSTVEVLGVTVMKGEGKNKVLAVANAIRNVLPNSPRKTYLDICIKTFPNIPDINDYVDEWADSHTNTKISEYLGLTTEEFKTVCNHADYEEGTRQIVRKYKFIKDNQKREV